MNTVATRLWPVADVGEKLVQQVSMVRAFPEVMVRVDDGQLGLEDGLGRPRGQPRLVRRVDPSELASVASGSCVVADRSGQAACRIRAAPRSSSGNTSSALAGGRLRMTRATPASR